MGGSGPPEASLGHMDGCLFLSVVFPVVMCGCESWIIKKAEL